MCIFLFAFWFLIFYLQHSDVFKNPLFSNEGQEHLGFYLKAKNEMLT